MSGSVNKAIILGTVGRDPELRYMPSGEATCTLRVVTSEYAKDKQSGARKEFSEWHNVVLYGKSAETAAQYLKKGSHAYFEGRIQTRKFTSNGAERYTTEIRVLDMRMLGGNAADDGATPQAEARNERPAVAVSQGAAPDAFDDGIPF